MDVQASASPPSDTSPWRSVYPTDMVGRSLANSLSEPVGPARQGSLFSAIGQHARELEWWAIGVWCGTMALANLIFGWYSDNQNIWDWYWGYLAYAIAVQLFLFCAMWYIRHEASAAPDGLKTPSQISVRSLRRAALAGNNSLAPTNAILGNDSDKRWSGADTTTYKLLPPAWRFLRGWKFVSIALAGMMVLFSTIEWLTSIDKTYALEITSGFIAPATIISILVFTWSSYVSRQFDIVAHEDGLRWKHQILPWSEVRGWFMLHLHPVNMRWTHPNTVYAVVGEHSSLTWLTYPQEVESQDPGKLLARTVQAHVSIPLRDLTPGAIRISNDVTSHLLLRKFRLLAPYDRSVLGNGVPRPACVIASAVLTLLILVAGIFTPYVQQWYYGRALTTLESTSTAMRDPLTSNTLEWIPTVGYQTSIAGNSFAFTSQGYKYLSNNCCDAASLTSRVIENGLAEITVHQHVDFDLNDAGIVFHASSNDHTALAFTVMPSGDWELQQFTLGPNGSLSDGKSLYYGGGLFRGANPIHQGLDATNRLAVLMQGQTLTFYVNGRYVGRYTSGGLPQAGQIGVYVGGMSGPVTFSELLISPT